MADMKPQQNDIEVVVEKNNRAIELVNLLKDGDRGVCCTQEYGTEEYELTPEHELKFRENAPALWKEAMLDETYMRRFLRGEEVSLVNVTPELAHFFSDEFEEEYFTKPLPAWRTYLAIYVGIYILAYLIMVFLPGSLWETNAFLAEMNFHLQFTFPVLGMIMGLFMVADLCCELPTFERSQFSRQLWYEFHLIVTRRSRAREKLCGIPGGMFLVLLMQALQVMWMGVAAGNSLAFALTAVCLFITIFGIGLCISGTPVYSQFKAKSKEELEKTPYAVQFFWTMALAMESLGTKEDNAHGLTSSLNNFTFSLFGDQTTEQSDMIRAIAKSIEIESKYESKQLLSTNSEHQDKNAPEEPAEVPVPAEVAAE